MFPHTCKMCLLLDPINDENYFQLAIEAILQINGSIYSRFHSGKCLTNKIHIKIKISAYLTCLFILIMSERGAIFAYII